MKQGRRPKYYGNEEHYRNMILDAVKCGHIYMAADNLGISHSAIRNHIIKLGLSEDVKSILSDYKSNKQEQILELAREGVSDVSIAAKLGISATKVKSVRIDGGIMRKRGIQHRHSCDTIRAMMMSELSKNFSYAEIADAFGCTRQNVHHIVKTFERGKQ